MALLDYSLNEIASKARLAARGAGYDWGMAEETASATFWSLQHQLPVLEALADLLEMQSLSPGPTSRIPIIQQQCWSGADNGLCPLTVGAALTDRAALFSQEAVQLKKVLYPVLLIPFLVNVATCHTGSLHVKNQDGQITIIRGGDVRTNAAFTEAEVIELLDCCLAQTKTGADNDANVNDTRHNDRLVIVDDSTRSARAKVQSTILARLDALAQLTYAPATEASRLLGAGAGLNDND